VGQSVLSLPRRRPPVVLRLVPSGRTLVIAAVLVVAAAGLYVLGRESSMFAVRKIAVQGAQPRVASQAREALRSFDGRSLVGLNGAAVVSRLEELPTIVSATYDRDFPHTLRVRVQPEVPVAVLRRGHGAWLASARGRVMGTIDRRRYRSLPRIWLPAATELELGAFLDGDAAVSARALQQFVSERFARRVLWARVQTRQFTLALRSGLELRFGAPTDLRLKIAIVRSILPTLALPAEGGPHYLDVSAPERPVAGGGNPQPAG
jgi:cell division protein FtsQ